MKRLSCFAVLLVFCLSIFAISVNPSMDGRAVVADSGIFPPGGYYGKAPGYLPGDTVVVTNHNNGFSIDVLILGTYDAYEGIAILLSPEAADKLNIEKGKDVYVKVQKKQPISYEEAVATSRNKKIEEKQALDTDKDSSVLPGQTEQLVNDVIASKNTEIPQDEVLPLEDLEPVVTEETELVQAEEELLVEEVPQTTEEVALVENEEVEITEEEIIVAEETENLIPQEEIEETLTEVTENDVSEVEYIAEEVLVEEELAESEEPIELAEPEEFVESEEIESPVFEVVEELPPVEEELLEVVEELPEENLEEVVLDDIQNENFDEADLIDTPVESEIAQVVEEELLPVEETPEEIAEVEEITEDAIEDEEYIVLEELPEEELEVEEEVAFVEDIIPEDEIELEEVETADETFTEDSEVEEILIPEEEVAEIIPEEEIILPEVLETESMEEEPELALADEFIEDSSKSTTETPKDIFSMIIGEELDEEIIETVVLEETEPKLPELDDSFAAENDVADLEIKLDEPESELSEIVVEAEPESVIANESVTSSVVSSNIDSLSNTVANFNDLPKVKNAKSKTYYIQIATANKEENVAKMIDLHGKKYPVYVIKNPAKASYQVLVGPLNDDEYALVLARFKQTYKDAFLRVLK